MLEVPNAEVSLDRLLTVVDVQPSATSAAAALTRTTTATAVRRRVTTNDIAVSDRGRIPAAVMDQYLEARARSET